MHCIRSKESINILNCPTASNTSKNSEHVLGDLNGSALYLLNFLVTKNILSVTQNTYNVFANIYLRHKIHLDDYKILPSLENKLNLVNDLISFINLFKDIQVSQDAILNCIEFILLGDEVHDRGVSDLLTLLLLYFVHKNNVSYESILSNHIVRAILLYYNDKFSSSTSQEENQSAAGLETVIKANIISLNLFKKIFYKTHLKGHLRLMSYSKNQSDKNDLMLHTHAPVPERIIPDLAEYFHINETESDKIVDQANANFAKILNDKTLFYREIAQFSKKNPLIYYPNCPIYSITHYRTQHETTEGRPNQRGANNFKYGHGHDGFGKSPDDSYIFNLDSSLGRPNWYEDIPGYLTIQHAQTNDLALRNSEFVATVFPKKFENILNSLKNMQEALDNALDEKRKIVDLSVNRFTDIILNTINNCSLTLTNTGLTIEEIPNTANDCTIYIKIALKLDDAEFIHMFLRRILIVTNYRAHLTICSHLLSDLILIDPNIVSLELSNCRLEGLNPSNLIKNLTNLSSLTFSKTDFRSKDNEPVFEKILDLYTVNTKNLSELHLDSCSLSAQKLNLLATSSKYIKLSTLSIAYADNQLPPEIEDAIIEIVNANKFIKTLTIPASTQNYRNEVLDSIAQNNHTIVSLQFETESVTTNVIKRNICLSSPELSSRLSNINSAISAFAVESIQLELQIAEGNAHNYLLSRTINTTDSFNTTKLVAKTPAEKILLLLDLYYTIEIETNKFNSELQAQQYPSICFQNSDISDQMPRNLLGLLLNCLNNTATQTIQAESLHINSFQILQKANNFDLIKTHLSLIFRNVLEMSLSKLSSPSNEQEFSAVFKIINDLPNEHYSYIDINTPLGSQDKNHSNQLSCKLMSAIDFKLLAHKMIDKVDHKNPGLFYELMNMVYQINTHILNMQNKLLVISSCCHYFAKQISMPAKENNNINSDSTILTKKDIKQSVAKKLGINIKLLMKPVISNSTPYTKFNPKMTNQNRPFWRKELINRHSEDQLRKGIELRK